MVPAMIRAVFGLSPDEMGISVIAMDSAFFEHVAVVFHDDRIRRRCAIVTDLDLSLGELPENPQDDDEEQKHARASQKAGEKRRQSLEKFTQNNSWIRAFYATYTFEVDFLAVNNVREASETVDTIYKKPLNRKRLKASLESDDLSVSGNAILKLAKAAGKGWFALLLSEKLHSDTFIPEYILRAIAFAADSVSKDAIKRMGLFRIADEYFDSKVHAKFPKIDKLKSMLPKDFIDLYKEKAPEDTLSEFMGYIEEYQRG